MKSELKSKDSKRAHSKPDGRWWLVLLALFFGVTFFLLVLNRTFVVAKQTATAVAEGGVAMVQVIGQMTSAALASGLCSQNDQHRIEVLQHLEKADFGEEVPDFIAGGVKLNLEHENPEVRELAAKVWDKIKDLKTVPTNISIEIESPQETQSPQ